MLSSISAATSIAGLVRQGDHLLRPSSSARLDAELLLAHVLERDRACVYRDGELEVTHEHQQNFKRLIEARASGQPIAQLLGTQEFWSLPFLIDEHVLIPRPETELLIDTALTLLEHCKNPLIADLGTGSGAIAIVIGLQRPDAYVVAIDDSACALRMAQRNCTIHTGSAVHLVRANWTDALPDAQFDLIVSNPPYVASDDPLLVSSDIRFEPRHALSSGIDGLNDLRVIVSAAARPLKSGGVLLVEHGCEQGNAVRALFQADHFNNIKTLCDLAGHERLTCGKLG